MDNFNKTAQGELQTAENTAITQINPQYGLLNNVAPIVTGSAAVSVEDNEFYLSESGTTGGSIGTILTKKYLYIKSGQGGSVIIDAMFDEPVLGNIQAAGLSSSDNIAAFGYFIDGRFGIIYGYDGDSENQELQITTPAGGAEVAIITLNDVIYNVNLTSGTAEHNAFEIAEQLNDSIAEGYFVTSNQDVVIFQSIVGGVQSGIFSLTSTTAVGGFTQINIGRELTFEFTPLTETNFFSPSKFIPQNINDYKIVIDGNIDFYAKDPVTLEFKLVHKIKATSRVKRSVFRNKIVRAGWASNNILPTSSNAQVRGTKCAVFIQGKNIINGPFVSINNTEGGFSNTVPQTVGIIRVRSSFNGKLNRIKIFPKTLSVASDSNKAIVFQLVKNPVYTEDVIFDYINKDNSFMEGALQQVVVTGGEVVASYTIGANSSGVFDLSEVFNELSAIDVIAGVVISTSGSAHEVTSSITWQEEIE